MIIPKIKLNTVMTGSGLTINTIPTTAIDKPIMSTIQSKTVFSLILKKLIRANTPTAMSAAPMILTNPAAMSSPLPAMVPMMKMSPRNNMTMSITILPAL